MIGSYYLAKFEEEEEKQQQQLLTEQSEKGVRVRERDNNPSLRKKIIHYKQRNIRIVPCRCCYTSS